MTSYTLDLRSPKITHRDIRNAQRAAQPNRTNPLDRPPVFAPGWQKRLQSILGRHKVISGLSLIILLGLLALFVYWLLPAHAFGSPVQVEQQVNLVDCGSGTQAQSCTVSSTTPTGTTGAYGIFTWDAAKYPGKLTVYFEEHGATTVSGAACGLCVVSKVELYNMTTSTIVSANPTALTDITSSMVQGNQYVMRNYCVDPVCLTSTIYDAHLNVVQRFDSGEYTGTTSYVDIGNNTTTAATTFTDINDPKIFKYDASKFDGSSRLFFEATSWTNGAARNSQVRLFDITGNTDVPMTTDAGGSGCTPTTNSVCGKGSTPVYLKGELTAGLADGHEYKVQMLTSAGTANLASARIIIQQKPVIDQQSTSMTTDYQIGDTTSDASRAQTFQVSHTGYYTGYAVTLSKVAAPTDLLSVSLRTNLDGTILSSDSVDPATLSTTATGYDVIFSQPVWLTSQTAYYLQFQRSGAVSATNYYKITGGTTDTYPVNGAAYLKGASWGSALTFDYYFSIYSSTPTIFESYRQIVTSLATNATATYVSQSPMGQFTSTNFVNTIPTYFYEVTAKTTAGTYYANLYDYFGSAVITNSEITGTGTTYSRQRSVDITANLSSGNRYYRTQIKNSATNTTSISTSWLVVDVAIGPTIASLAPNKGPLASGTPLTIYGFGFRPGATVTIGGSSATSVSVISSGQISAIAPSGTAGAKDVVVTNSDGTTETFGKAYTYATEQFAVTKSTASDFSAGTLSNTETVGVKLDMSNWLWTNWTSRTTGGSMAANTYYYKITALDGAGNETTASPESAGAVTTGSSSSVSLGWRPVASAVQYKVYRTTTSGTYTTPALIASLTTTQSSSAQGSITYTDTAASTSSGAPPGSTASVNGIGMSYGAVPSSGAGTFSAGPAVSAATSRGGFVIQRPDGKFLVIGGNATTGTSIYDPIGNSFSAGPTSSCSITDGGNSFMRPDGKFVVFCGGNTTAVYDPAANSFAAGATCTPTVGTDLLNRGGFVFQRPDGKFVVIGFSLGNGYPTTSTSIYDPVANTCVAGNAMSAVPGSTPFAIRRPDKSILIILGAGTSATSLYDPNANTFSAGSTVVGTSNNNTSTGCHGIRLPNGKYLIVQGGVTSSTAMYDPIVNSFSAGPAVVGTTTSLVGQGAHALQRPDGKFLELISSSDTSIYDPSANSFSAGPAISGTGGTNILGLGGTVIQRQDGKYLVILANGTTATSIYDAGWLTGTTAQNGTTATFTSEALNPSAITSWNKLSWQQTADNDVNNVEVRTATTSGGLSGATYRTVSNGQDIAPLTGEVWLQYRVTTSRTVPGFDNTNSGYLASSFGSNGTATENRKFGIPNLPNVTATYSKLQVSSIAPNTGKTAGGTPFTITGTGFSSDSTVIVGGASATNIFVISSTTITGVTPSGTSGARDVVVTNPSISLTATFTGGFTYGTYSQTIKNTTASYTAAGSSLTNLSTSGIQMDSGIFQWQDWTPSTTGGSMAAATYYYSVTATDPGGGETTRAFETTGVVTTGATSSVSLKWRPVSGATGYKVYRTTTSGTYGASSLLTTISAANSSTINSTISYTDTAAATSSGQPPASNTTAGEMTLSRGAVPSSGAGTVSTGPTLTGGPGTGAHSIQRPDGKFLIIIGNTTTTTNVYDPVANTMSAGPALTAGASYGAHSLQRPDGKFLIIIGNTTTTTSVYDPVSNTMSVGPTLTAAANWGAHSLQRPDGKFLIILGNATTTTNVYDPVANMISAGPTLTATASSGGHSIQRPDGKFLIIHGNSLITTTNIYDPVANTIVAGPALAAAANDGAHSIQRPDGKFLIILGNFATTTNVYDPVANTMSAGPTLTAAASNGAHSIQRPDGKFLIIIGNSTTTTNIYDPVANTMSAGPALTAAASNGAHSIQRPDGKFLVISGNASSATSIYDAGWTMGTSAQNGTTGTYVSEDMSTSATWDKIGWVKSIDNTVQSSAGTVDSVEIKTANTQAALTSATYREVVSGGAISPGTCEPWIKIKITYTRPQATWSRGDHPGANVWLGESSTFENRDFDTPTIQSLTISAFTGSGGVTPNTPTVLKQLHSDGATTIPTGAGTSEDKTVFSASLTTSAASDSLALQVEIQPIGTSFTGTPNETGSLIPCSGGTCSTGITGTMNMIDTPAGSYHWQARSGSCAGTPSAWQPYPETPTNGDTPPAALDFQILGADSLMRGGKTFINGVEQAACSTGYCH